MSNYFKNTVWTKFKDAFFTRWRKGDFWKEDISGDSPVTIAIAGISRLELDVGGDSPITTAIIGNSDITTGIIGDSTVTISITGRSKLRWT